MKKSTLLLIFLLAGIILAAGCTGPASTGTPVTGTPVPASPSVPLTPSLSAGPTPFDTSFPSQPPANAVTFVPTTRIALDNPHLEYLNIRKKTFDEPLPNCLMQNAFPAIAKDPGYGIKQVEPKLSSISEDDYLYFLRKFTEGNAENTQLKNLPECQGTAAEPTWNFVEVRLILDPTNIQPSNYTITLNVKSGGKIIAQFPRTEQLVINHQLNQLSYIPLRTDEMDLFDSVGVTYTRL